METGKRGSRSGRGRGCTLEIISRPYEVSRQPYDIAADVPRNHFDCIETDNTATTRPRGEAKAVQEGVKKISLINSTVIMRLV